jgi:hypothetical protein
MDVQFNIAPLTTTNVNIDVNALQSLVIPVNVSLAPDNTVQVKVEPVNQTNTVVNIPEEEPHTQSYHAEFNIVLGDGSRGASAYQS